MLAFAIALPIIFILIGILFMLGKRIDKLEDELAHCSNHQRELQAEFTFQQELQSGLLHTIQDAVIVLDSSQVVIIANASAVSLAGNKMVGDTLIAALPHTMLDELVQESSRSADDELVERMLDFQDKKFQAHITKVSSLRGKLQLITLRDITVLKRAELARRSMVANISHELRTPITTIGLLAETLADESVRRSKKGRKMVDNILREVATLGQLVQEMRDLSRIESGQMPIKLTPMSLYKAITESVEPLIALSESKQQQISIDISSEIMVLADPIHIERAIRNVIHNAIKFTPEQGRINISTSLEADQATIVIQDSGGGIAAEDLPRIFERFFQADQSRKDGTGLGLAIARHIVRAHGGEIWAESVVGEGSIFYLTLALAQVPQES